MGWKRWVSTLSLFVLVGCGGGGNASNGSSSIVTPSPTPTPVPTSTLAAIATGATAFDTSQFMTITGSTQMLSGDATSARSVTGLSSSFGFSYSPTTGTYTLSNEQRTQTFGPSPINETSLPDMLPRVEYEVATSNSTDYMVLFKQPYSSPAILNDYVDYGVWQHNMVGASMTDLRLDYFIYGTPTPASSMPHSGTVTYRWLGTGNYAEDTKLYFAETSYSYMTVDFDKSQVTTLMNISGSDFLNGGFGGLVTLNFSGQISGNAADGQLSCAPGNCSGIAHVVFFGPNAENMGIVFSGNSNSSANGPATFNGAGVGVTP